GQVVRRRRFLRFFSQLLPGQTDSPAERDQSQRGGMPLRGIQERRGLGLVAGSATLDKHVGIVTSRVLARQYGADTVIHREGLVKMSLRIGPTRVQSSENPEKPVARSQAFDPDADVSAGPRQQERIETGCALAIVERDTDFGKIGDARRPSRVL